jgi:hypothetical protein
LPGDIGEVRGAVGGAEGSLDFVFAGDIGDAV